MAEHVPQRPDQSTDHEGLSAQLLKLSKPKQVLLASGVLVALCIGTVIMMTVISAIMNFGSDDATPTAVAQQVIETEPEQVVEAAAVETEPPTATPEPTEVPEPPTATPEPTATQVPPTATPANQTTAEDLAYISFILGQTDSMSTSMGIFSDLMTNNNIGNATWRARVGGEISIWRANYQQAQSITPPKRFAKVHAKWLSAMKKFNDATYSIEDGIDNLDASKLDKATLLIQQGTSLLQEATALIDEIEVE